MGNIYNEKGETVFVYKENLYLGFVNNTTGLDLWRTADGTKWTRFMPDGFGDSNNYATLWSNAQASFKNSLYIGTWNSTNGGEIWQMLHQVFLPFTKK
jgi:hypothetical protein